MIGQYLGAGSGVTKGLYHLNGNATDSSGNGNNGTATNVSYVAGINGSGAASFNGGAKIQANSVIAGSTNYSVSFSVKDSGTPNTLRVFMQDSYGSNIVTIGIHTNNQFFIYYGKTANYSGVTFTNGFYTITKSGSSNIIYLNGKLLYSFTDNFYSGGDANLLLFGCQSWLGGYHDYMTGLIDEVIIENRSWSASEKQKYYTYSKGRFCLN